MELKAGKRYLITQNVDNSFGNKKTDTETLELISEVVVDEISISDKYVRFNSFVGFPISVNQWNRIDSIDVLEELPDKKIKDNEITQNNVYDKLLEILTKVLDNKVNKRKKCKK